MNPIGTSDPHSEASPEPSNTTDRSVSSIVGDLWLHTERLLDQELKLLRADVDSRTVQARNDLIELSLAGGVAYTGALALVTALILALAKHMDAWLAALIVGAVAMVLGYAMFKHSTHKLAQRDLVPRRSVENVETTAHEIVQARPWAHEQTREALR